MNRDREIDRAIAQHGALDHNPTAMAYLTGTAAWPRWRQEQADIIAAHARKDTP